MYTNKIDNTKIEIKFVHDPGTIILSRVICSSSSAVCSCLRLLFLKDIMLLRNIEQVFFSYYFDISHSVPGMCLFFRATCIRYRVRCNRNRMRCTHIGTTGKTQCCARNYYAFFCHAKYRIILLRLTTRIKPVLYCVYYCTRVCQTTFSSFPRASRDGASFARKIDPFYRTPFSRVVCTYLRSGRHRWCAED